MNDIHKYAGPGILEVPLSPGQMSLLVLPSFMIQEGGADLLWLRSACVCRAVFRFPADGLASLNQVPLQETSLRQDPVQGASEDQ